MRIYFFGDSICFGQFVSPHRIWVNATAAALTGEFGDAVTVQNPSVNGRTTRQALEDMPYQVQSHRPDVLYVQYGMNDCNYWQTDAGHPRVACAAFRENLKEILQRGRNAGAKLSFLGTNHPTPKRDKYGWVDLSYQDSNHSYNVAVREVAAETGAVLVDHEAHWLERGYAAPETLAALVLADGVHLSLRGHEVYAAFAIPRIAEAIRRQLIDA